MPFDRRLQQLQAGGMDLIPDVAHLGDADDVVGQRLGAVIDKEDETGGEQHQADKSEEKADHGSQQWPMDVRQRYSAGALDSIVLSATARDGRKRRFFKRKPMAARP